METQEREIVDVISLYGKAAGRPHFRYPVDVAANESHAAMLGEAYALTNMDDRPLANKVPATSPGDILTVRDRGSFRDRHYLVLMSGFKEITPAELMSILSLDISGTMQHILSVTSFEGSASDMERHHD